MISRTFVLYIFLMALFGAGCSSKPTENQSPATPVAAMPEKTPALPEAVSPPPSPEAKKTVSAPAGPKKQEAISYDKNPERFVKYPTEPVPFNVTDPKTAQEHFNVGVNFDNQKDFAKATEEYGKALEMKPDWALAHARLAHDADRLGHTDDAIAHWEQAVKYDPQFYQIYDLLAAAYERQGNLKKAIEAYSALLTYPPAQMPVHYQLAPWYARIGDSTSRNIASWLRKSIWKERVPGSRRPLANCNDSASKPTARRKKSRKEQNSLRHSGV